jgi:flavin reductase (DIM6/NTAB) family NADH-FMN oxidoreductase RutF
VAQKAFTISIPSQNYVKEVDYFGIVSGKHKDKFAATGLTPVKSDLVHTQFVGEIVDMKADEAVIGEDGLTDIEKVKPIAFALETKAYHEIGGFIGRAWSIGKEIKRLNR